MTSETAPRKYAAALLHQLSAAEAGKAAAALAVLAAAMEKVPALMRYMGHPEVAQSDKEALLKQALASAEAPAAVLRFVLVLLQQGQLASLPMIARALQTEVDQAQGVQAVDVASASALTAAQKKRLTDDLTARLKMNVRMAYTIDPTLLGGVVVRTKDRVLDGSVRGRLNNLRQKLLAE